MVTGEVCVVSQAGVFLDPGANHEPTPFAKSRSIADGHVAFILASSSGEIISLSSFLEKAALNHHIFTSATRGSAEPAAI